MEDGDAVESALQAAVRAPRRGMQDFMAIPDYLLQLEWDHLNAETATLTSRCDLLLNRVIRNGGRCISEHSFKRVTSMLMLTSESAERLAVMSRGQKHDMNNFVKDEFKQLIRVTAAPAQYLEVLPSNFELFLQMTQGNQAYRAGQVPVRCPLDFLEQIRSMETSFKCRGVGSVAQSMQLANAGGGGQAPLLQLGAGGQLERFAGLIFAGMGQMQDTQNRLLQAFTSSPQRQTGSPLSSHSLMDSSSHPYFLASPRRMPPLIRSSSLEAPAFAAEELQDKDKRSESVPNEDEDADKDKRSESVPKLHKDKGSESVPKLLALMDERDAARKKVAAKLKPKEAKAKPAEAVGDATAAEAAEGVHDKVMRKPAAAKSKKPGLCLERTRSQVMCRSGLGGPGSTKAIKYGPGAPFKSEEDALRAACTRDEAAGRPYRNQKAF